MAKGGGRFLSGCSTQRKPKKKSTMVPSDSMLDYYESDDSVDSPPLKSDKCGSDDDYRFSDPATNSSEGADDDSTVVDKAAPVYIVEELGVRFLKMPINVMKGFNSNEGTKFEFENLVDVTSTYDRGLRTYFLAFEATDSDLIFEIFPG
ncbi:OLC1v1008452C1 [Oldenlandia corymbosa var. corymbosa]|uniref:OLC1v1008452C1 n=1 Tax=Oldenlandia corymbosa var. corymbosa TaxID=529605 RepID=A0AAV1DM64_OLDCO|nr:OLC1v1008452C1 [Oldenlandia corymbosa var. corymbosa]